VQARRDHAVTVDEKRALLADSVLDEPLSQR
jgi:hypothetical protein